jgi:hypothetical protein
MYMVAGLCLLTPLEAFHLGRWVNGLGVVLAVGLLVRERVVRQRAAQVATP